MSSINERTYFGNGKALLDKPDEVQIREIGGGHTSIIFELRIAKEDLGKVNR